MDANIAVQSMKQDPAIFEDPRVIENILQLNSKYQPSASYFDEMQCDVKPKMRKILLSWMLEVRLTVLFSSTLLCSGEQRFTLHLPFAKP